MKRVVISCNGCGLEIDKPVVEGRRADGFGGGRPLPDEGFEWCANCALIAFNAVKEAVKDSGAWLPMVSYLKAKEINDFVASKPRGQG